MTPQERAEFEMLKQKVAQLERVEHVPFIENLKRRVVSAEIASQISTALAQLDLEDLRNVTITSVTSGQVLEWNGTEWVNATDNV